MRPTNYLLCGLLVLPLAFTSCGTDEETVKKSPTPAPRVVRQTIVVTERKPARRTPSAYEMEVVNSYDPQ